MKALLLDYEIEMGISEWLAGMLRDGRYRSKQEIADACGLSEPAIVNYTKGRRNPSAPACIKLAEGTGTPLEEVVRMSCGDEEMPPTSTKSA